MCRYEGFATKGMEMFLFPDMTWSLESRRLSSYVADDGIHVACMMQRSRDLTGFGWTVFKSDKCTGTRSFVVKHPPQRVSHTRLMTAFTFLAMMQRSRDLISQGLVGLFSRVISVLALGPFA